MTYQDGERRRVADVMRELRTRLETQQGPVTDDALARQLGLNPSTFRSWAGGRTMPKPKALRALAELVGVPVSRVYADIGWLPQEEVSAPQHLDLMPRLEETAAAVARLSECLDRMPPEAGNRAPLLAAAAVLTDQWGAGRFRVQMQCLMAGERHRLPTTLLAEFTPVPGVEPLDARKLSELAVTAGLPSLRTGPPGPPGPPGLPGQPNEEASQVRHRLFRTELEALTAGALRQAGEFSWHGEPGTSLWRSACRTWPTHLLVQHLLTGQPFAERQPWESTDGLPLVVIGAEFSIGPVAPLLAEALGWRYIPVSAATVFDGGRAARSQPLEPVIRRGHGWAAAARHARTVARQGTPWPAVLLVRPYLFGDQDAFHQETRRLLLEVPAHVVHARPTPSHLAWWARRREFTAPATRPAAAWRTEAEAAQARVEEVMAERRLAHGPDHDLGLDLAPLSPPPDAAAPVFPDALVDEQVACAERCLDWLDEVANKGRPTVRREIRPSRLTATLS